MGSSPHTHRFLNFQFEDQTEGEKARNLGWAIFVAASIMIVIQVFRKLIWPSMRRTCCCCLCPVKKEEEEADEDSQEIELTGASQAST